MSAGYIVVSDQVRESGMLSYIKQQPVKFISMVSDSERRLLGSADVLCGSQSTRIWYLKLSMHLKSPTKLQLLLSRDSQSIASLRVLVCEWDSMHGSDPKQMEAGLLDVNFQCVVNDVKLLVVRSAEECATIVQSIATTGPSRFEALSRGNLYDFNSRCQAIATGSDAEIAEQVVDWLSGMDGNIGQSDIRALLKQFKTLKNIASQSVEDIMKASGFGRLKAEYVHSVLHAAWTSRLLEPESSVACGS